MFDKNQFSLKFLCGIIESLFANPILQNMVDIMSTDINSISPALSDLIYNFFTFNNSVFNCDFYTFPIFNYIIDHDELVSF